MLFFRFWKSWKNFTIFLENLGNFSKKIACIKSTNFEDFRKFFLKNAIKLLTVVPTTNSYNISILWVLDDWKSCNIFQKSKKIWCNKIPCCLRSLTKVFLIESENFNENVYFKKFVAPSMPKCLVCSNFVWWVLVLRPSRRKLCWALPASSRSLILASSGQ